MKVLLFVSLVLLGCTKKVTPESFLKDYIYSRYGKKVEKSFILENAAGEFYSEINSVEGEKLDELLNLEKYRLKKFTVHSKECDGNTCTLSYSIKYKQEKDTVYSKKIVELEQTKDVWKISRVNNVKTFIESSKIVK